MNLGDIQNRVRNLYAEPSTRRFTQAIIADFVNGAQTQLAFEVSFPEASLTFPIANGTREYQLPELLKILRVYMLGPDGSQQPLFGTDIPTLEGEIQETYDNTSGAVEGSPVQSPLWLTAAAQSYPVTQTQIGGRVPTKSPYYPYSRPSYYLRGGYIGITIPPISTSPQTQIKVDYIPVPPNLNSNADVSIFPSLFLDAIAWKTIEYMRVSDNLSSAADATARYNNEVANKINPWIWSLQANRPKSLVPTTRRTQFRRSGQPWG